MPSTASLVIRLLLPLCSLAAATALAQAPAAPPRDSTPPPPGRAEQQIERIRHEDTGSRIDELRVGGETRNIAVQPKGDAPAYEVAPQGSNRNPADSDRERSGPGGWNILKY